jgi:hypothetical protein
MLIRLLFLFVLFSGTLLGQCAFVDGGADFQLNCADPCTTIVGNFTPTYQTNTYGISSIPYNPNPYNVGTLYSIPIDDRWSGVINLPFTFCFFGVEYINLCWEQMGLYHLILPMPIFTVLGLSLMPSQQIGRPPRQVFQGQ